jgi:zinc ribbon protein
MFCPKCGAESLEEQRFCKACGTNLQLINNALKGGGNLQSQLGIDMEALKQNFIDFGNSWRSSVGPKFHKHEQMRIVREIGRQARDEARRARNEVRRRNLPRPTEWMRYSWQHSLKNGLISIFAGSGMGVLFYYLGKTAIDSGAIKSIEDAANNHVHGLEPLVAMLWLFALIPVLKGIAQIIYAAFFAESMKTLSERYTVKLEELPEEAPYVRKTEPQARTTEPSPAAEPQNGDRAYQTPPSVTEHTTRTFDDPRAQRQSETS